MRIDLFPDVFLICSLVGVLAGLTAGLLGVGGGIIIVPALVLLLPHFSVPTEFVMHTAVATSLAVILPTSIVSALKHHHVGAVDWSLFKKLAPGLCIGAIGGVWIASLLPRDVLQPVFGVFELAVAYTLIRPGAKANASKHLHTGEAFVVSTGIGSLSTLLGIGGGTMTVPYLAWRNTAIRRAVATSAACGVPIALAGVATFSLLGREEAFFPVSWPVAAALAWTSLLSAPLGVRLTHVLPVHVLRRLFALLLVVVAVRMLWP